MRTPSTGRISESGIIPNEAVCVEADGLYFFSDMTQKHISAIPTEYNDQLYRSKLEARWAVFFDLLGVHAAYEHSTKEYNGITYTPDFEIMQGFKASINNTRPLFEVKPSEPSESYIKKLIDWHDPFLSDIFIVVGMPSLFQPKGIWIHSGYNGSWKTRKQLITHGFAFIQCRRCREYYPCATWDWEGEIQVENYGCDCNRNPETTDWEEAAEHAANYRFDLK